MVIPLSDLNNVSEPSELYLNRHSKGFQVVETIAVKMDLGPFSTIHTDMLCGLPTLRTHGTVNQRTTAHSA